MSAASRVRAAAYLLLYPLRVDSEEEAERALCDLAAVLDAACAEERATCVREHAAKALAFADRIAEISARLGGVCL